ncbi:MAG: DUF1858 domain-containing protein [Clostridium sp.]|nr:DUF1858 domain-containing protein [Clostridium sp.]
MSLEDLFKDKPEPEKAPELVTKDMIIGDILKAHPHSAEILMACGMGCIGCPSSLMESLEEASLVHGFNPDEVLDYLNEELAVLEKEEA